MLAGDRYIAVCIHGIVKDIVPEKCTGDGFAFHEILTFDDLHDLAGTVIQLLGVYNDRECFYHDLQKDFVRHLEFALGERHHSFIR